MVDFKSFLPPPLYPQDNLFYMEEKSYLLYALPTRYGVGDGDSGEDGGVAALVEQ